MVRTLFQNIDLNNIILVFIYLIIRYNLSTLLKCLVLDLYPVSNLMKTSELKFEKLNFKSFIEKLKFFWAKNFSLNKMFISIFIGLFLYTLKDEYPNLFKYPCIFEVLIFFIDFKDLIESMVKNNYDFIMGNPGSRQPRPILPKPGGGPSSQPDPGNQPGPSGQPDPGSNPGSQSPGDFNIEWDDDEIQTVYVDYLSKEIKKGLLIMDFKEKLNSIKHGDILGKEFTEEERNSLCNAINMKTCELLTVSQFPNFSEGKDITMHISQRIFLENEDNSDYFLLFDRRQNRVFKLSSDRLPETKRFLDPFFKINEKKINDLIIDVLIHENNKNNNKLSLNELIHYLIHNNSDALDSEGRKFLSKKRVIIEHTLYSEKSFSDNMKLNDSRWNQINKFFDNPNTQKDRELMEKICDLHKFSGSEKQADFAYKLFNLEKAFNNRVYDPNRLLTKQDLYQLKLIFLKSPEGQALFDELTSRADSVMMRTLLDKFQKEQSELKDFKDLNPLIEKQDSEMEKKLYKFSKEEWKAKRQEIERLVNQNPNYLETKIAEFKAKNN